ncbi:hypothetical protein K466DRAFT_525914 [Polyporus arcularius HHB13444]|uniref:BTB domain-containing protein n=1 Tax=Polyporus arcularius HHB13444 TaxID=1314778 RepID=A0A5C3PHN6_9APHY|nr:hypothetical protein K466DRAFT_525914 [Polyporus arcularius HHB13444]
MSSAPSPHGTPLDEANMKFWYSDGNIVVKVERTLFKLHRHRLASISIYFEKLFASDTQSSYYMTVDGCPIYHVPPGLTPTSFGNFMRVLDTPIALIKGFLSEHEAIELLHTANLLCCPSVSDFDKDALAKHWNEDTLPDTRSGTPRTYDDAVAVILLARKHSIPGVLKRAFYEALSQPGFLAALSANPGAFKLPRAYVDRMHGARVELGRLWREFALRAPGTDEKGKSKCQKDYKLNCNRFEFDYKKQRLIGRCSGGSESRKLYWREIVIAHGALEDGAADPIRYNLVEVRKEELDKVWCNECLEAWEREWMRARSEWWKALDGLLWL